MHTHVTSSLQTDAHSIRAVWKPKLKVSHMTNGPCFIVGTQRFIRVNVYSCSSSSLLATFSEQNKDFFRNDNSTLGLCL